MVAWPGGEPALDPGLLVGAVVVVDEVEVKVGGHRWRPCALRKLRELLGAVARLAMGEDLAGGLH